jgi:hypothetical protein
LSTAVFPQICCAIETTFDIQISQGSDVLGTGQVTTTPITTGTYLATGGSLELTSGLYAPFNGALVPNPNANGAPWVAVVYGGTDFIGLDDLIVKTGPSTFGLDANGILFNDPSFPTGGGNGLVIALWNDSPGPGNGSAAFNGYNNNPWATEVDGLTITLTNVPDPGTTSVFLLIGLVALSAAYGCFYKSKEGMVFS